jgi:peptidoglycan/LPS O-acetylase OafA/YrhL
MEGLRGREATPEVRAEEGRIDALDAIRGIAAFVVLLHHAWLVLPTAFTEQVRLSTALASVPYALCYVFYKLLTQGGAAVIVFFVLSGFVLTHSLQRRRSSYPGFVVKRVFRIYPAFLCAVLLSYALHAAIGAREVPGINAVFNADARNTSLSVAALAGHLAMTGLSDHLRLDVPIWSLVHEMRVSLVFPVLVAAVARWRWRALLAALAVSAGSAALVAATSGAVPRGFTEPDVLSSWLTTAYFGVFFVLGTLLALERQAVAAWIARRHAAALAAIVLLAVLCLVRGIGRGTGTDLVLADYGYGLGAVALIAVAVASRRARRGLALPPLRWLGRVSYSLYLVHVPVIYAAVELLGPRLPLVAVLVLALVAALLSAAAMARLVEAPGQRVGRRFARRLERGAGASAPAVP